jgi:hypothetical protein
MDGDSGGTTAAGTVARRRAVQHLRLLLTAGALLLVGGVIIGLSAGRLAAATATPRPATAGDQVAGDVKGTMATLTIRIKTPAGKLVKTLKGSTSTDKTVLTWNFDCALPNGHYRVCAQVSGIACTP